MFTDSVPNAPFDFIFDRGCFHLCAGKEQVDVYLEQLAKLLNPTGTWLSIMAIPAPPAGIIKNIERLFQVEVESTYLELLNNESKPATKLVVKFK